MNIIKNAISIYQAAAGYTNSYRPNQVKLSDFVFAGVTSFAQPAEVDLTYMTTKLSSRDTSIFLAKFAGTVANFGLVSDEFSVNAVNKDLHKETM